MKRSATNLARALEMLWYLSMGLFLGLTGGLVLAVILTFRGARAIDATPGAPPFSDPRFADVHNDAVAGYIGQELFMVGGSVALGLLGLAVMVRIGHTFVSRAHRECISGSKLLSAIQFGALTGCLIFMGLGASITLQMNALWPDLYDLHNLDYAINVARPMFEKLHQVSERYVGTAWLCGLIALSVSPWCRRVADAPPDNASSPKQ